MIYQKLLFPLMFGAVLSLLLAQLITRGRTRFLIHLIISCLISLVVVLPMGVQLLLDKVYIGIPFIIFLAYLMISLWYMLIRSLRDDKYAARKQKEYEAWLKARWFWWDWWR